MLAATKSEVKKQYIVKYGYVYSDAHGNHYKPGEIVMLTAKEYDLAAHRVTRYVNETQVVSEGLPRKDATIYRRVPAEIQKPAAPIPKPEPAHEEPKDLNGILGRGKYEVK